ncbi:hypothetical protein SLS60_000419 [Paraconiothyrium brasiliense]|uniref:Protein kinase domain-containing protein n=1 Tax=Paraconiothyrium brasiliense TaxID=300254 RepID=A0ABR3S6A5_9PLEO
MDSPVSSEVFQKLSTSLFQETGKKEWRDNPILYFILLQLGREDAFQDLLDNNVTDLWLPIPKYVVLKILKDEKDKKAFLEAQEMCLDDRMPTNLNGQHLSLMDSDCLELNEQKFLGSGRYGEVHHVVDPRTGIAYARKSMSRPRNFIKQRELMKLFKRELNGMRRVRHAHCVTLMATCTDTDSVIILSSPVADMDLAFFLDSDLSGTQLDTLCRAVGCITSALAYLHQLNISLDFSDSSASTTTGPPEHVTRRYSAPEAFDHEPRNRLTDIWSLGCVLFEILTRLYGYKLSEMKEFWRSNNTRYDSFAENPDATTSWLRRVTLHETKVQHGYSRRRLWMISFIYHVLLQPNRLLRPTALQVMERLQDLDAAFPVNVSQSWVGTCCATRLGSSASLITFRQNVPQWPMLDLMMTDDHLAYLFLDVNLELLAVSRNLSFLDDVDGSGIHKLKHLFTAGPSLEHIQHEARLVARTVNPRDQRPTDPDTILEHAMSSIFTCLIQDTTFWVYFFDVKLENDTIPRIRTVQISLHTWVMERQPGYGAPFIVMTFDPNEGEVTRTFDPAQGKIADFSYREGRDLWMDGLSIASTLFQGEKRARYATFVTHVSKRRNDYNRLVSWTREIMMRRKLTYHSSTTGELSQK